MVPAISPGGERFPSTAIPLVALLVKVAAKGMFIARPNAVIGAEPTFTSSTSRLFVEAAFFTTRSFAVVLPGSVYCSRSDGLCTLTVAVAVVDPPLLVAVSVYVVWAEGVTVSDVFPVSSFGAFALPSPSESAVTVPVTVQLRVDELPVATSLGLAVETVMTGFANPVPTVTVTSAGGVPPRPGAGRGDFVVVAGVTTSELPVCTPRPLLAGVLSSETCDALVTVHSSVELPPALMVGGVAVKAVISGSDALELGQPEASAATASERKRFCERRITACLRAWGSAR